MQRRRVLRGLLGRNQPGLGWLGMQLLLLLALFELVGVVLGLVQSGEISSPELPLGHLLAVYALVYLYWILPGGVIYLILVLGVVRSSEKRRTRALLLSPIVGVTGYWFILEPPFEWALWLWVILTATLFGVMVRIPTPSGDLESPSRVDTAS